MNNKKKDTHYKQPIITAVDLGTSKIRVIIAAVDEEENLNIRGIAENYSEGIDSGIIRDIRLTSEIISKTIAEAENDADTKAENMFVSISGEFIKSTNANSRLPITDDSGADSNKVTISHLNKVVKTAVELVLTQEGDKNQKVIHSIPQSYQVDNQKETLNPIEMSGDILTAHIHVVLANVNCIKNIHRCFELIGYNVEQVVFSPLATCNAVLTQDEMKHGCILMDIGAGTTDLVFFYDSIIMISAVIGYGGNNISSDISKILHTSSDFAEQLKIEKGIAITPHSDSLEANELIEVEGLGNREPTSKKLSFLCEVIQSRTQEMLDEAYNNINIDELERFANAGIVLTGGTSSLRDIDCLTNNIFNMPVRIGAPKLKGFTGKTEKLKSPQYSCIVGLLLYARKLVNKDKVNPMDIKNVSSSFKDFFKKLYDSISDFF